MDRLITAAARALASGDPMGALNRVALRDDAPALALRGIAVAQLGDLERARGLLRQAARQFGPQAAAARARCVVAEAEIALAVRDLAWPDRPLAAAGQVLARHGDAVNAAHVQAIQARRWLLLGRLAEAERALAGLDAAALPLALQAVRALVEAGIAMRRMQARAARQALQRALHAAQRARIQPLVAEVGQALQVLDTPAARLSMDGRQRMVILDEVESLAESGTLVVDACRHTVRDGFAAVPLARRPVLFMLARALGQAWPADVPRDTLIAAVFRTRHPDDSHRARLRVEMGRLRKALRALARVEATRDGYVLAPAASGVAVLAWPDETPHAAVLALLADGESWSSSALALALNASQRTVQRALDGLAAAGKARPSGSGRGRRWQVATVPQFATSLLLPGAFFHE